MTTKELTCAQRIDKQLKLRETDILALINDDNADWASDSPALSIDRRELFTICLSWGGPADYIEVTLNDGEVEKVIYRFSDWFDTATVEIDESSPLYEYALYEVEMMRA